MRTRLAIALSLFGAALAFANIQPAAAEGPPSPPPGQGPGRPHGPDQMIQRFDKNNNHALEAAEVPPRMWARISVADANGDGSITAEELQAAHASGKLPMHHRPPEEGGPGAGRPPAPAPAQGTSK